MAALYWAKHGLITAIVMIALLACEKASQQSLSNNTDEPDNGMRQQSVVAVSTHSPDKHEAADPHVKLMPDKLAQVALQHRAEGRIDEAISSLNLSIKTYPNNAYLYAVRASLLMELEKYDLALQDLNKAAILDSEDALVLVNRAQVYRQQERTENALDDLNRAIQVKPDLLAAYFNRGAIFLSQGEKEKALKDFNTCITLQPNTPAPYFNRATIHFSNNQTEAAIADLKKFIQLSDSDEWKNQANTLIKKWSS